MKGLSSETIFDFVLLVLGVLIAGISLSYGFGSISRPGPGLYPFFIGLAVILSSAILMISSLRFGKKESIFDREGIKIFALMLVTFCLWILIMPLFGYVIVTFLATYAFSKIMKLEGWWKPLVISAATALFIFLLFDYWLYIDLPRGMIFG